jgi:hypothetical protein
VVVRITIDIVPSLEEDMIDCLLEFDRLIRFSSYEIRRHGDSSALSTLEKVTGRARALRFDVLLEEPLVDTLLTAVRIAVGIGAPFSISRLQDHGVL